MWMFDDNIPPVIKEAIQACGAPLLLTDYEVQQQGLRPVDIKRWCQDNLKTFVWMEEQDCSDVNYQWDYIYAFFIGSEQDRNWFHLRWGGISA